MVFLLALLAVAFRLAAWGLTSGRTPEVFEYDTIARNLLEGRGYVYSYLGTSYYGFFSGYPYVWLMAAVYWLVPWPHVAMVLVQCLLSVLLVAVIQRIGALLAGPQVGYFAAGLVALHPGLAYYDVHKLHPLSFDALMMAGAALAVIRMLDMSTVRRCIVAGLWSGAALLERGSFAPVVLLVALGLGWSRGPRFQILRRTLLYLGAAMLLVGPWLVRSTVRYGAPLLSTANGIHLWLGNNPQTTGSSLTLGGIAVIETMPPALAAEMKGRSELEQMRILSQASWRYIAEDPAAFVRRVSRRLAMFAWKTPTAGLRYPPQYARWYHIYYALMVGAALCGIWVLWRGGRLQERIVRIGVWTLAGIWLSVGVVHSLLYVEMRHRWGVEPLMLVMAAIGWRSLLNRRAPS